MYFLVAAHKFYCRIKNKIQLGEITFLNTGDGQMIQIGDFDF